MNWVDLIIILTLTFFTIEALGRSFLSEVLDLVSFLLAFFLSFRFYNLIANFFGSQFNLPHGLSLVLGFMAVWFLSEAVFAILVRSFLIKLPKIKVPARNFLTAIPAFLRGLILIALFLVVVATFPIQPSIKKGVQDSKLGNFILQYAYHLEQPLKQIFGGVSNDTLTFLTIEPKADERVNLGFQTNQLTIDSKGEEAMIVLVNHERTSREVGSLEFDANLREVARSHSEDMFKRGYFSHYSPEGQTVADRADKEGVNFLVIGENLAYAPSLELAHNGLMNSPGHRANILSTDFRRIGIGIVDGGIYGKMWTQVFSD